MSAENERDCSIELKIYEKKKFFFDHLYKIQFYIFIQILIY